MPVARRLLLEVASHDRNRDRIRRRLLLSVPVGVARISAQRDVSAPASRASCGAAAAAAAVCRRAAGRGAPRGALGAEVAAVAAMCGRACCREAAAGGAADSINVSKPSTKLPAGDASSMAGSRGEEASSPEAPAAASRGPAAAQAILSHMRPDERERVDPRTCAASGAPQTEADRPLESAASGRAHGP